MTDNNENNSPRGVEYFVEQIERPVEDMFVVQGFEGESFCSGGFNFEDKTSRLGRVVNDFSTFDIILCFRSKDDFVVQKPVSPHSPPVFPVP